MRIVAQQGEWQTLSRAAMHAEHSRLLSWDQRHSRHASGQTELQGTPHPPQHSSLPGVHTRALQASASSQPPPSAMPATAATVGLGPEQGVQR